MWPAGDAKIENESFSHLSAVKRGPKAENAKRVGNSTRTIRVNYQYYSFGSKLT